MIIDAHTHFPVASENRTHKQAKELFLADMSRDQTDYAIVIPDNQPHSAIGDLPTCLALTENDPELFLMGTIDIQTQGQEWVDELERMIVRRRIVGMKIFPGHDPIYPTDPRLSPVYALCQSRSVPMVIHTGINPGHPEVARYNNPKYIAEVAGQYPGLKIVVAHLFWPEVDYCYECLHPFPSVFYDTSGLADDEVIAETGKAKIEAVLLKILKEDPRKIVFGTDYAMCDRPAHIRLIESLPVSDEVREGIFWRNARDLFNLSIAGV